MVGLNPGKFYGRLLPRPRIYCDVKFSDARVDPPQSVNAALLEWAGEASWKMGGTAAKRKRMSGKIEGRMSKLRAMEESDDEGVVVQKETKENKHFSSVKKSPGTVVEKAETPIEKMLSIPKSKQNAATRRSTPRKPENREEKETPVDKQKPRRNRKEQMIQDSDCDSDDETEGHVHGVEAIPTTPTRVTRGMARLASSPLTPQSRRGVSTLSSLRTPTSHKRKHSGEDLNSDTDVQSELSDSLIL